jgi:CHAT domain-containing protein/tetratricopeptide (TPR) repeat protein
MKNILAFLFLLLPLFAFPQSRQSDQYYEKGTGLFDAGKYEEALIFFQKSDSLDKAQLSDTAKNYHRAEFKIMDSKHILASRACNSGKYTEAVRHEAAVTEIARRVWGKSHLGYANSLNLLSNYCYYAGDLQTAVKYAVEAAEIRKNILGGNHPDYAISLSNISVILLQLGNYAEAVRLENIETEIIKKILGENHPEYASSLNNLASSNAMNGNYAEAVRLGTLAAGLYKKLHGEDYPDYIISQSNLAYYNSQLGNYAEAVRLGEIVAEKRRKDPGEKHPLYALALSNLAAYYFHAGSLEKAVKLVSEAAEIQKNVLGEEHPKYAVSLNLLANFKFSEGKYYEAAGLYEECFQRNRYYILKNLKFMTYKERADFWNANSKFFSSGLPFAAYKISGAKSGITAFAYDGLVFSKGLLLNAELEIQKLIEKSGDTVLTALYNKIKRDRALLDNLNKTSAAERKTDADSLRKVINSDERKMVEASKELGDYTKNLSVRWTDIQKQLKNNDLAVEFVDFEDTAAKTQIYAALVLKKGMKAPAFVKLFDFEEFDKISSEGYYRSPKLYGLVWKKLIKYLKGVKNVYFSPSGIFHTTGIEYLPDESGKIFAEKFNVYRLSSTRELALVHNQNPNKKAATYGGIKYDGSNEEGKFRSVAAYLKGSKIESDSVAKLLRSADFSVIALSDTVATEESFKALSGTGLKILHIGTHGFYLTEDVMEKNGLGFLASGGQTKEERSLGCSGLLFAGANVALVSETRGNIPAGYDDGILTAKEISRLDFQGLDLVVLSACQTGLGEVTGEGVFGLQRGFKKAGAQTIIMSLWEVDDYATRLLMTEFFKGLTAGKTKREAFVAALDYVKAKNSDPKYWAAFVMVDGE